MTLLGETALSQVGGPYPYAMPHRSPSPREGCGSARCGAQASAARGIVNLLSLSGVMGMVGVGRAGSHDPFQATVAVAVPVIWFQMMNRSVIVRRYSAAESR